MNFTDIFIRRPVLATVVSLLIFIFGLRAIFDMQIRQFPKMESTVITVTTAYPGADAGLIEGFITSPIEASVASAEGIDYMTSSSTQGVSTITCNIKLNFNPQVAFTDIMSKVTSVQNQLPKDALLPVITKTSDNSTPLMYISLDSVEMTPQQITDYATRVVVPQLEAIDGVSEAQILGGQTYAMRIFLDPKRMAAFKVTPADIYQVLANNNFLTAAGSTKGPYVSINVTADTDLNNGDEFSKLIVKSNKGAIVRIKDVGSVALGSQNYDSTVTFNGRKAIFLAITPTPSANPLDVIKAVRNAMPAIAKNFPPSLQEKIVYDATEYIRSSIKEVIRTIVEAGLIVIVVILLFLGSLRSVLIPIVTIPLSLIGVTSLMLALGYSLNLLTLLAMVLAIGLVVDDAIVVLENIHRHIEENLNPFNAALIGAREIALPIVSMTITLAAVYAPIGFMGGLTGALFKEFAFTLACAVVISGVIALTLSPMMCSRLLRSHGENSRFVVLLDNTFNKLKTRYQSLLHGALDYRPMMVVFAITVFVSLIFLYLNTPEETAPLEDQGFFLVTGNAPQYANINYVETFSNEFNKIYASFNEMEDYFAINGFGTVNTVLSGMVLKPWDKRKTKQQKLLQTLQDKLNQVAGLQTYTFIPPPLPGSGSGTPIQFAITTTSDFQLLYNVSQQLLDKARNSGLFIFIDNSLKFDKPQVQLMIDRSKASDLGLDMRSIGSSLASALSGGYVNYFNLQGRSYEVIPQLDRQYRMTADQLQNIYVKSLSGDMVSLNTVTHIKNQTEPNQLTHFQQLNAATLQGVMTPGKTIGEGIAYLQQIADELLPKGFSYDYGGQSRQYIQEGSALLVTFFFSVIIIFLVLAAQFESFRDPFIILVSVPMSICGALIPLNLGLATINIYTQVGLITLIGLITKHGILMVDFANHLQREKGLSIRDAIEEAASIRLRPILMTTAAMIFGVIPLVLASGAGAESRFDIGLVIATGMLIGTCFTLFVVPTMYTFFAIDHSHDVAKEAGEFGV